MDPDSTDKTIKDDENTTVTGAVENDTTADTNDTEALDSSVAEPNVTDTGTDAETVVPDVEAEPSTNVRLGSDSVVDTTTPDSETADPAPINDSTTTPLTNAVLVKPTKPKKKWLLTSIIAAIVIVAGGGASAYAFWYQAPDKVVTDATLALFSTNPTTTNTVITSNSSLSPGSPIDVTLKKISIDTKSASNKNSSLNASAVLSVAGRDYTLSADALSTTSGDFYFKLNNLSSVIKQIIPGLLESDPGFSAQLDKIQNTWVKLSSSDIDSGDNSMACTLKAMQKYTGSKDVETKLQNAYKDHKFITIKDHVGSKDGSLGYDVGIDRDQAKQFSAAVADTDFAKELKKCNSEEDSTGTMSPDIDQAIKDDDSVNATATIWVSRWTHQLTSVDYSVSMKLDKASQSLKFSGHTGVGYTKVDDISIPSGSTDFKDWFSNLENLIVTVMFGSSSSTDVNMSDLYGSF